MKIGYACLTVGVIDTDFKSCIMKNATEERLLELIEYNLNSLENIIDYNIKNNIKLFRISSDIIPFGSSPVNKIQWWEVFKEKFSEIGEKIKANKLRVSMHPGQYTVLNSPKEDVVIRAIDDLVYHTRFLDSLNLSREHKIILHVGGVYDDKNQAIMRFIENYKKLSNNIKARLVIENDDKSYKIDEVLSISSVLDIPVIFDNLHHQINICEGTKNEFEWIEICRKTWKQDNGDQKIHYSQQNPNKNIGAHSETITAGVFLDFYNSLLNKELDIMMEVKDKNLSAIKCINMVSSHRSIKKLELEWSRYKYNILERSPNNYQKIRNLLKNKESYPALEFYNILEDSLNTEATMGNTINGLAHVWGYFKDTATIKEKEGFFKNIDMYEKGEGSIKRVKNYLWKLAIKYDEEYLKNSYYFSLDL